MSRLFKLANRVLTAPAFRPKTLAPAQTTKCLFRNYGAPAVPSKEEIVKRCMEVLQDYEKVDETKVTIDAHFLNDLGLDSLDTVSLSH